MKKIKNIFVTGSIKIGKTSIMNKVLEQLGEVKIGGFRTLAIFENDIRKGFALESFKGQKQIFAHTDLESSLKFDIYRYDVSVFEKFGTQLLEKALENSELIVMDEIGMMEKNTIHFKEQIKICLDEPQLVLGAFQKRAEWFFDILNERADTKIFFINEINRETIHKEIISNFLG
jgi:nucleoside-triphosphatase